MFYWELGESVVDKQKNAKWGSGFIKKLSEDLTTESPDMKRFSYNNLQHIRRWYLFYFKDNINCGTVCSTITYLSKANAFKKTEVFLDKLVQILWGHKFVIISKCAVEVEAIFYVQQSIGTGLRFTFHVYDILNL